jgi:hypothetical protein
MLQPGSAGGETSSADLGPALTLDIRKGSNGGVRKRIDRWMEEKSASTQWEAIEGAHDDEG